MIIVLSPAKTLDSDQSLLTTHTKPQLLKDSQKLVDRLKGMSARDLSGLMKVSDKIADLNYERYQTWRRPFNLKNAKQAIFTFKGDVYLGLKAEDFDKKDLSFAQQHLRMLSGLYGVLRPLDLIQPYRLEMGCRLQTADCANLYEFWGDKLTQLIQNELAAEKSPALINLASNEYFKSIRPAALSAPIITPVFKENKNGTYKIISFLAKKARGMMSRYIIKHGLEDINAIKQFRDGGYRYRAKLSNDTEWVFTHG